MRKKVKIYTILLIIFLFTLGCQNEEPNDGNLDNIEVQQYLAQKTQWIFLFYLGGDNDLEEFLIADVKELASSTYNRNQIKAVILLDRPEYPITDSVLGETSATKAFTIVNTTKGNRLMEIAIPALNIYPGEANEADMADPNTLKEFITYGKSLSADHYALFFGSHGSSWWNEFYLNNKVSIKVKTQAQITQSIKPAIIYDYTSASALSYSGKAALDIETVGQLITLNPVDLIGFDACSMASFEVAYALRNGAKYLVASMDLEPADGWNYQKVLDSFKEGGSPLELGKALVENYGQIYKDWNDPITAITLAMIDLSQFAGSEFQELFAKDSALALGKKLNKNRALFFTDNVPKMGDLTTALKVQFDSSYLLDDALGLDLETKELFNAFLTKLILYKYISNTSFSDLSGIAISVLPNQTSFYTNYFSLSFAQETSWGDYLDNLYP